VVVVLLLLDCTVPLLLLLLSDMDAESIVVVLLVLLNIAVGICVDGLVRVLCISILLSCAVEAIRVPLELLLRRLCPCVDDEDPVDN